MKLKFLEKLKEKLYIDYGEDELDNIEEYAAKSLFQKDKKVEIKKYKYINRETAIDIANKECNLRRSLYKEFKINGYEYGLIELNNFYATLVVFKGSFCWYIKVLDGKYGYKDDNKYYKGIIDEDFKIRCLIMAENGRYIYLDNDFDTRELRMVRDDEFLEFLHYRKR